MILLLSLVGLGLAQDLPPWPKARDTTSGECVESYGLTKGTAVPSFLASSDGLVRCSAVVEPLSSYEHLLLIEVHAKHVRGLYTLDTRKLERERDYWQAKAERANAWYRQPLVVAVTTSALVTGIAVAYSIGTGGR